MGGIAWRVGDYSLVIKDYEYPKEYDDNDNQLPLDENHIFNVTVRSELNSSKKELQVPLHELYDLDKNKHFLNEGGKTPREWLFNKLKATSGIFIVPELPLFFDRSSGQVPPPDYFLNSDIFDEDIKVSLEPRIFKITDLKEIDWLYSKGFNYSSRKARLLFDENSNKQGD